MCMCVVPFNGLASTPGYSCLQPSDSVQIHCNSAQEKEVTEGELINENSYVNSFSYFFSMRQVLERVTPKAISIYEINIKLFLCYVSRPMGVRIIELKKIWEFSPCSWDFNSVV